MKEFNLLATTSRGNEHYARSELSHLFEQVGDLAPEFERLNIPLEFAQSSSTFYDASVSGIESEPIEDGQKKGEYQQQIDFGTLVDGCKYCMALKDTQDIKIINRNSECLYAAKIFRTKDDKKPEVIEEGLCEMYRWSRNLITIASVPPDYRVEFVVSSLDD